MFRNGVRTLIFFRGIEHSNALGRRSKRSYRPYTPSHRLTKSPSEAAGSVRLGICQATSARRLAYRLPERVGTGPLAGSIQARNSTVRGGRSWGGAGAGRKPRLLLRLPGLFLLRLAARQLEALLFQEPPRFTRLSPWPEPVSSDAMCGLRWQMQSTPDHGSAGSFRPRHAARISGSLRIDAMTGD